MELQVPPHTLFQKKTADGIIHNRIFMDDFIHSGEDLHEILNTLHESESKDTLEVRINSSGGYARYGQQFINVMNDRFRGRSMTVIEAEALSIAALIFIAGDIRVVYPHSNLLFHDVSLSLGEGKASEAIARLKIVHNTFFDYMVQMLSPYFSKKEIKDISNGLDISLDAYQMCERGIATTVLTANGKISASEYLETF